MFNSNFLSKMTKSRFNLRKVVAIAICLAVTTMFLGCNGKNKDKDKDKDGNGNGATIELTISLEKGVKDDEIIIKCTPAITEGGKMMPLDYLIVPGRFYNQTQTGGDEGSAIFAETKGWNTAGTEFTYAFDATGGKWEGTITLKPIDPEVVKEVWSSVGIKSIKYGKNDPVPLKVGY
jgi:hypothetical protein